MRALRSDQAEQDGTDFVAVMNASPQVLKAGLCSPQEIQVTPKELFVPHFVFPAIMSSTGFSETFKVLDFLK